MEILPQAPREQLADGQEMFFGRGVEMRMPCDCKMEPPAGIHH